MDFDLQYKDFRMDVRRYVDELLAPHAAHIDREQIFSKDVHRIINDRGWWGCLVPKEYGGLGLSTVEYAIVVEEVSRVCGSTGLTLAAHNSLGTWPIYYFGTKDQKEKYLPPAAKNGSLIAFGLTEPEAGSDAGGTKSKAVKTGDHYLLNGTKCWITSSTVCDTAIVTARTSEEGGVKGISSFILEKGMPGFSAGKKENKLGCRGSDTAYMHFDDVRVPEKQLLGEIGNGFREFMMTLDGGRISIGAMAIGLAQAALDHALKFSVTCVREGKAISNNQGTQFMLADMAMQIETARLLMYKTAWMKDNNLPFTKISAMCKLYASEVANFCTSRALDIYGAEGILEKHPVERFFRDMKLCEIGEGTSEVQRIVIARELLREIAGKK